MKYGIYYAYWEKEWKGYFVPYVKKAKELGFDILEVACGGFHLENEAYFRELRKAAEDQGIILTGGYGPRAEHNLASADPTVIRGAFAFYGDVFKKMEAAGIHSLCGALYSYWPVVITEDLDKEGDFARSARNMEKLADMAADHGIVLHMEALNRFEGYLINTCEECLKYVKAVGKPNVKAMLDTFHMNVEEDSLPGAIEEAGAYLGHFHVGEANRKPPWAGGRMPWKEMGEALHKINYQGYVVMEPFVQMGGQVGRDICVWRDISGGASPKQLDEAAAASVAYLRNIWEG